LRAKAEVSALPPEWVARSILAADSWGFPPLVGVVEGPTLRPDGSLLDEPGYDVASGLLYIPDREFPRIQENPTSAELITAVRLVLEPLRDFPFVSLHDRAAAVSAILSLVARSAIRGPVPMHALRATAPGTGKGLLADVIAIVGTGRPAARTVLPPDDGELRKAILAIALEGLPAVLLDNVDRALGSSSLAAALTAEVWRDRLLGLSRTAEAPLRAVWLATGNGLTFRGDLGRRVVPVDLDAHQEHPEDRAGFVHPDLLAWVRERRPDLVAGALTVLRGYTAAGRPPHRSGPRKGSFEGWDDLVRGACVWAEFGDPARGCDRIRREDDSDLEGLRTAIAAWLEVFGDVPRTASEAVAEAITRAESPRGSLASPQPELRDAILALTPGKDRLDSRALGYALRRARGRIVEGLRFVDRGRVNGATSWSVAAVDGGDGRSGDTGHVS
jgi:putative DNA primase/helicase